MKFRHSCGSNRSQILPSVLPSASNKASKVLAPIRRRCALRLAKAISIGLRSGLSAGRNRNRQPRCLRASAAGGGWTFVGGQIVEDDNGARIEGRSQLGFDTGVECRAVDGPGDDPGRDQCVLCQPGDECLRSPFAKRCHPIEPFAHRRATPRRRVRFVLTAVSSIKTSLCGSRRILGWRRMIHSRRARRSAGRSRSAAISPFFI